MTGKNRSPEKVRDKVPATGNLPAPTNNEHATPPPPPSPPRPKTKPQDSPAAVATSVGPHTGTQERPTNLPSSFDGRSGSWACEKCGTVRLLAPHTRSWKCAACQTTNYTVPPKDCPLDAVAPCCCWNAICGAFGSR